MKLRCVTSRKLSVKKSVGPDGLSAKFLKEISAEITIPLTNKSLETGVFPSDFMRYNVTPVYKSGAKDNPGNFCPISVVFVVAKVMKKIVAQQLSSYFENNHLLSPYQCAYRRNKSTEQLLMVAIDTIAQALDNKICPCVAFLDLQKAFFDSLDHNILLQRLNTLGIVNTEILWFQNYLSGRLQCVKHKDSFSSWGLVRGGIPQGSALGPLLFLVYMNSMTSQVVNGTLLQYADDTALICSGPTFDAVHKCLSEDLHHLSSWIKQSRLKFNVKKSSIMWFKPRSLMNVTTPDVMIDGDLLREVDTQKYLGVIFDKKMNWSSHVSTVCSKVSFCLFWINSHRKSLPSTVSKMLINS